MSGQAVAAGTARRAAPGQVDGEGGPSRNAPCPCGSGRKYKRCHGAPTTAPEQPAARRAPAGNGRGPSTSSAPDGRGPVGGRVRSEDLEGGAEPVAPAVLQPQRDRPARAAGPVSTAAASTTPPGARRPEAGAAEHRAGRAAAYRADALRGAGEFGRDVRRRGRIAQRPELAGRPVAVDDLQEGADEPVRRSGGLRAWRWPGRRPVADRPDAPARRGPGGPRRVGRPGRSGSRRRGRTGRG